MTNNRMYYQKTEIIMYDNCDKWYEILYAEQTLIFNPSMHQWHWVRHLTSGHSRGNGAVFTALEVTLNEGKSTKWLISRFTQRLWVWTHRIDTLLNLVCYWPVVYWQLLPFTILNYVSAFVFQMNTCIFFLSYTYWLL